MKKIIFIVIFLSGIGINVSNLSNPICFQNVKGQLPVSINYTVTGVTTPGTANVGLPQSGQTFNMYVTTCAGGLIGFLYDYLPSGESFGIEVTDEPLPSDLFTSYGVDIPIQLGDGSGDDTPVDPADLPVLSIQPDYCTINTSNLNNSDAQSFVRDYLWTQGDIFGLFNNITRITGRGYSNSDIGRINLLAHYQPNLDALQTLYDNGSPYLPYDPMDLPMNGIGNHSQLVTSYDYYPITVTGLASTGLTPNQVMTNIMNQMISGELLPSDINGVTNLIPTKLESIVPENIDKWKSGDPNGTVLKLTINHGGGISSTGILLSSSNQSGGFTLSTVTDAFFAGTTSANFLRNREFGFTKTGTGTGTNTDYIFYTKGVSESDNSQIFNYAVNGTKLEDESIIFALMMRKVANYINSLGNDVHAYEGSNNDGTGAISNSVDFANIVKVINGSQPLCAINGQNTQAPVVTSCKPTILEAAEMADYVLCESLHGIYPRLDNRWTPCSSPVGVTDGYSDGYTGQLFVRLNSNNLQTSCYAYSFSAPEVPSDWKQFYGQKITTLGLYSHVTSNANTLITKLSESADVTFVGHSIGGGLASLASMVTGKPAITFNASSLSAEVKSTVASASTNQIAAYTSKYDPLTLYLDGVLTPVPGTPQLLPAQGLRNWVQKIPWRWTPEDNHSIKAIENALGY